MYQYAFRLKQITPMIHFQHQEVGAALRATEVKPKLDRFILSYMRGRGKKDPRVLALEEIVAEKDVNKQRKQTLFNLKNGETLPESLIGSKGHFSLGYKLRFHIPANAKVQKSDAAQTAIANLGKDPRSRLREKRPINGMYFGNMVSGRDDREKRENIERSYKETVFYPEPFGGSIISGSKELIELIKQVLPAFFLLHNFGTRQTKGFGSFLIDEKNDEAALIKQYSNYDFLRLKGEGKNSLPKEQEAKMNMAKGLYALMKGGINGRRDDDDYFKGFMPIYFLDEDIGNEKFFIKNQILRLNEKPAKPHKKVLFVRALLGLTDQYKYTMPKKALIKVESKSDIERYPSPLIIKITDHALYLIPKDDGKAIMGKTFLFDGRPLAVPQAEDLPDTNYTFIEDFLYQFSGHFEALKKNRDENNVLLSEARDKGLRDLSRYELEYVYFDE